ncbi:MAG: apolipoprotein N-acyltransferase [Alistipes sp.]|nr:apolipoprotein N-acyltransferase [Candidatus Alistipes equi]
MKKAKKITTVTEPGISYRQKIALVSTSVILLSAGWWNLPAVFCCAGLVPLIYLSHRYSASKKDFMGMLGWAALTFILWNCVTIWWIWYASPIGPIAATFFTVWWDLIAFMCFHVVSKKGHKLLSYILLVTGWTAVEFIYSEAKALSFPWLNLGNAFARNVWAVQWYEYTGIFGGTFWVVLVNILLFEAIISKRKKSYILFGATFILPLVLSIVIYLRNAPTNTTPKDSMNITVCQPNIDCYLKFNSSANSQHNILKKLLRAAPAETNLVLFPETALKEYLFEKRLEESTVLSEFKNILLSERPDMSIITGCESIAQYTTSNKSETSRKIADDSYIDYYNSSLLIQNGSPYRIHHKQRLVVGVETLPKWLRHIRFGEVDLGGTFGQLGLDSRSDLFECHGVKVSPAICYEALYGNTMAEFTKNGAGILCVISNDGWWGDTPGYKRLFDLCRLRAIENRRWIARSANTGISGFLNSRGDIEKKLEWDRQGELSMQVPSYDKITFYTKYGDIVGRISMYTAFLCLLYFVAYTYKRKFYLD